ncbi:Uncharacterized conserved protein, tellurite resistance protein B (TerB) family [Malonomonas rubra DSM 5091]|uniref:Uncharacterized conserved protein, tellurite resistance protein B (TerB) family n=1 Tax=Malonomonas rubra DSM 5091 TaxID=1122189 RepID=A0A1M6M721_MALRU|nr:TerB family tellurite resistance protein [Malonomonas rubra]SHJ79200.1 Uncharacterized conserved protein, tellurite resistance protein B (TerB) family [Malonomonas rubra DSM 5091]
MIKHLLKVFAPATEREARTQFDRIPLAAAVLLLEVAHADGDYHVEEEALIGQLLKEHFNVADELLAELLELAEETRSDSSDLHQFTRDINKAYSQPEKEQIIEAVWQLVYADGRLDHFEEALMRQLGTLIGLSHRQLIDAKLRVSKG